MTTPLPVLYALPADDGVSVTDPVTEYPLWTDWELPGGRACQLPTQPRRPLGAVCSVNSSTPSRTPPAPTTSAYCGQRSGRSLSCHHSNTSFRSCDHISQDARWFHAQVVVQDRLPAIACATMVAFSPTPNSSDDLRLRRKWTPQKKRPGTTMLAPSLVSGKPAASKAGKRTQRA